MTVDNSTLQDSVDQNAVEGQPAEIDQNIEQQPDGETSTEPEKKEPEKVEDADKGKDNDSSVIRQMRRQLRNQAREIDELRKSSAPKIEAPKRENFDSDEEFVDARVEYREHVKAQAAPAQRNFLAERIGFLTTSDPEFREAFEAVKDIPLPSNELNAAMGSLQYGDEVLKKLVKDPDLMEDLSILPPAAYMAKIGELHAKIRDEKRVKSSVSKAPAPIQPVTPKGSVTKDYDKMSFEEFEKVRREERKAHKLR
jgi:hypothetical protein